jgi:hypothetical protein
LESQKRFSNSVRLQARNSLASYLSYYISVKNEPTVTSSRLARETEERLSRARKLSSSARIYLNLRLGDTWPVIESGLAAILQVEQNTTVIDLYETFLRVAQRLAAVGCSEDVKRELLIGLRKLRKINDFRIEKLISLFEPNEYLNLGIAPLEATDLLLRSQLKEAIRSARDAHRLKIACEEFSDAYGHAVTVPLPQMKVPFNQP